MPFTIPNDLVGTTSTYQSNIYATDLDVLQAGVQGIDCVLSGLAVTGSGTTTVAVAKGSVISNGIMYAVAANGTLGGFTTLTSSNHRFDLIVVTSAGSLAVRTGTSVNTNTIPIMPSRTANDVVIACIYQTGTDPDTPDVNIVTADIVDKRVFNNYSTIYKHTTNDAAVSFAAAKDLIGTAGTGLTIPNGLFTTGKMLEFYASGYIHIPTAGAATTVTVAFLLGGTTIWSDVTGSIVVDNTDEYGFVIRGTLAAQTSSSQALTAYYIGEIVGARTAPTSGTTAISGDLAAVNVLSPIMATSAINMDDANRVFTIRMTATSADTDNVLTVSNAYVRLV